MVCGALNNTEVLSKALVSGGNKTTLCHILIMGTISDALNIGS